ncbi:hypothetical protein [Chryseobacterium paridis]|uniref:Lipoprotein n=1 Tax=Chryseobacterium paridis TaxID=2800328 RepID=A0ABS1FXW5_9FLAO|nr:hypothetical protein [Chryseobacterium paridis]MBK1897240.1 hypothetical protein [Chryseobacterium paridis]
MKKSILLLLLASVTSCQKEVSASFDINIESVDESDKRFYNLSEIKILKNNKVFKILKTDKYAFSLNQRIKIDSIEEGKYTFVYTNLFGDKMKEEQVVDEAKNYRVSINPDKSIKKIANLAFESLRDSKVKLIYNSNGCFHHNSDSVILENIGDDYFVRRGQRSKKLDKDELAYFISIENRIRQVPQDGGCTTSDRYVFENRGKADTIIDGTCNFHLYNKISNYLKKNNL